MKPNGNLEPEELNLEVAIENFEKILGEEIDSFRNEVEPQVKEKQEWLIWYKYLVKLRVFKIHPDAEQKFS